MKDQMIKRGLCLSSNEEHCVLCTQSVKNLDHLLFIYLFASKWDFVGVWSYWYAAFSWNSWNHFVPWWHLSNSQGKKDNKMVILLTVFWSLWKIRNGIVFNNGNCNINDTLVYVKFLAWKWSNL